jgi:chromosome segregation protein
LAKLNQHLTKEVNSLERQSDSINRDLRDLNETETKLHGLLEAFGFDSNMETFDVEPIVQGLNAELSTLNALNAKAPETYLEVSYGYRSMSSRKNSLEEERNSIVKFIEGIEKDKRQTFLDAFDLVDKEIRLIFSKMTGGNAWLELQNEDDIFNSGISYLIQFKNKPKRESTSISGGEKTLAAIVFVLALQKLKPSPFYLFDEVDAHLDAPNAEKLSNILEERSKESQFIMVSLKDSVVNKAKLIYGVYPKNGVSQVITYKDKRMPSVKTS